jgi:hypothetical protein
MISLERLMKILNKDSEKYSREEVINIRDLVYRLAHLQYNFQKKYQKNYDTKH